ncbi:Schizosaccharomyces specific protein, double strand break localizing Dbl7 [Schizosaccharomyces osmophilus]|uniref:Schizosaccharomyces specific protein, double strand break localizing Dbl7 n=1 Tax=Schizosaccharomyces osmophilus TaxID=2545709 RepID=A0AAE9W6W8_9SCHI|nr:Schizosaccharomyces specific protein, double strand break localizing Dbl7 [Schizosaccharomyces osmophilus]WBW70644.1 Schizosaccharomyces specific protein, double strand break localizing Dbl7 [Schizosaccharomyces osmophilus]
MSAKKRWVVSSQKHSSPSEEKGSLTKNVFGFHSKKSQKSPLRENIEDVEDQDEETLLLSIRESSASKKQKRDQCQDDIQEFSSEEESTSVPLGSHDFQFSSATANPGVRSPSSARSSKAFAFQSPKSVKRDQALEKSPVSVHLAKFSAAATGTPPPKPVFANRSPFLDKKKKEFSLLDCTKVLESRYVARIQHRNFQQLNLASHNVRDKYGNLLLVEENTTPDSRKNYLLCKKTPVELNRSHLLSLPPPVYSNQYDCIDVSLIPC